MQLYTYVFFVGFIALCKIHILVIGNPMHGISVRRSNDGEFPFVVSVKRSNPYNERPETDHVCTGVLVSKRDVLTVEHCNEFLSIYTTEIIVGSRDLRAGKIYNVAWWINYNDWIILKRAVQYYQSNDILMIRLIHAITEDINPVTMSPLADWNFFRSTATVAGFGSTCTDIMSRYMETVDMRIISRSECEHRIRRLHASPYTVTEQYICGVADPPALMCNGNSGSVVIFRGDLIGIHKGTAPHHENPIHPEKVNLFISIDYYGEYIIDVIHNY